MPGDDTKDDTKDETMESPADAPASFRDAAEDPAPTHSNPAPTPAVSPAIVPPAAVSADAGYTAGGVPTFESVREKIETRYGTSIGAVELGSETPEGRRVAEQYEARQQAAADRLEQIRKSMKHGDG